MRKIQNRRYRIGNKNRRMCPNFRQKFKINVKEEYKYKNERFSSK